MLCLVTDAEPFSFIITDGNGIIGEGDAEADDGICD
jgi:hypothetical protein